MKIDIGCGLHKQRGYEGVDVLKNADHVVDIVDKGLPFKDSMVDEAIALAFMEHVPQGSKVIFVMNEVWRVLKDRAEFRFTVPDTNSLDGLKTAFMDPTHVSYWNEDMLRYFVVPAGHEDNPKAINPQRPRNAEYGIKPWILSKVERIKGGSILNITLKAKKS